MRPVAITFEDWLVLKGRTLKTAAKFIQTLSGTLTRLAKENDISDFVLTSSQSASEIASIAVQLSGLEDFKTIDRIEKGVYSSALKHYLNYLEEIGSDRCGIELVNADFERNVKRAKRRTTERRQNRLLRAKKLPDKVTVSTVVYLHNADVVAEVLYRAEGNCEHCRKPAPFDRGADGAPYLEIHYRVPFTAGGEDTVENAVAMCPNCHRQAHYG